MNAEHTDSVATLSSAGEYSYFSFGNRTISFMTGKNLDRYVAIKEWDHGYIVVMCKTKSAPDHLEEDYIDLTPILVNLYIDPNRFLEPIKEVRISYV